MTIGMVVTKSEKWYRNVLQGLYRGNTEVDYWTSGWLPDSKKNLNRLEVYFNKNLILTGVISQMYKDTPYNVFQYYQNNLYAIGLQPGDNEADFNEMLNCVFEGKSKSEIGNIIFYVDGLSSEIIDGFKEEGMKIPKGIKLLPQQEIDIPISRISYK